MQKEEEKRSDLTNEESSRVVVSHVVRRALPLNDHLLSSCACCFHLFLGEAFDRRDRGHGSFLLRWVVETGDGLANGLSILHFGIDGRTKDDIVLLVILVEGGHHRRLLVQRQTPVLRPIAIVDLRLEDADLLVGLLVEIVRQASRDLVCRAAELGQGDGCRLNRRVLHRQSVRGDGRQAPRSDVPVDLRAQEDPQGEQKENVNDLEDEADEEQ